jgi:hypothetical protein
MSEGTGWPGNETPESYNVHANVKLTEDQKNKIAESGESESQWIREAVEMRLAQEMPTDDQKRLALKAKIRAIKAEKETSKVKDTS